MPTLVSLRSGLLIALVTAAFFPARADAAPAAGEKEKVIVLTRVEKYVLDFSGSEGHGVPGGNFDNFAFTLKQPMRKISLRHDERREDVIATYDYADCTKGQESLLETPVRGLAAGNAAWVDYVDVEMLPLPQENVRWAGGVCYGYRTASGRWHWRLAATPLAYDPASHRVRARIWVKQANVDALKLVFDATVPRQAVQTVTVTTLPAGVVGSSNQ